IVISTLIIAFFTAAEMAIMSINKNKIKDLVQEGNKKAMLLTRIISEPVKYLVAIRTLMTFAGVGVITLAANSLSRIFVKILMGVPFHT
ncbi:MAG: CNNM domain-containing protein, partial [Chloroflexota bacterium]